MQKRPPLSGQPRISRATSHASERPLGAQGRDGVKALSHEVVRYLNLASDAETDIVPALYIPQVHPELRLRKEYVRGVLPRTPLAPYVEESREGAPALGEVDAPHARYLEVVLLLAARGIDRIGNIFIHERERPRFRESFECPE